MQLDMHYYGVYVLARAAGLSKATARTIANCSQFVDDNALKGHVELLDGARIDFEATAHHAQQLSNLDPEDQRRIWVPFHFLPGNKGNSYTERLICKQDSDIAKAMVEHNLSKSDKPFAQELIGITAHVYADTFSHFGFSGISSRRNKVDNNNIKIFLDDERIKKHIEDQKKRFKDDHHKSTGVITNIKSWFAETFSGALGHAAVVTMPDRPYLKWRYTYEYPKERSVTRDNHETFLLGCEAIHGMFVKFKKLRPDLASDNGKNFASIKKYISKTLAFEGKKDERIEEWRKLSKSGDVYAGAGEAIPDYELDKLIKERINLRRLEDSRLAIKNQIYRFYQAASAHRNFVLRDLLPSVKLVVD